MLLNKYGALGEAAPGDVPGARYGAVSWSDAAGNFWLFGGQGCDSTTNCGGALNDLWKYSGGEWTWVSGWSVSYPAQPGVYGNLGTPAPGNHPGGRYCASGWMGTSGNLWIFGGIGLGSWDGNVAELNDLWKFSGGDWIWMSGPEETYTEIDGLGTYGAQGIPALGNNPGARDSSMSWTDANGNLWLFGGEGYGSTYQAAAPYLNDLWKFNAGEWAWVSGSNVGGQTGTYGSLGTPASGAVAGARIGAVTWTDANGNLWLFGGTGLDSTGTTGDLNDLWVYQP